MKSSREVLSIFLAVGLMIAITTSLSAQSSLTVSNRTSLPIVVQYETNVYGIRSQQTTPLDPMFAGFNEFADNHVSSTCTVKITHNGRTFDYPMNGAASKSILFDGKDPQPQLMKLVVKNYSNSDLVLSVTQNQNRPYAEKVRNGTTEEFSLGKNAKVDLTHELGLHQFVMNDSIELLVVDSGMMIDGNKIQLKRESQLVHLRISNSSRERMLIKYFNGRGYETMMQVESQSSKELDMLKDKPIYVRTRNDEYTVDTVIDGAKIVATDNHLYVNGRRFESSPKPVAVDSLERFGIEGYFMQGGGYKLSKILPNSIAQQQGLNSEMVIVDIEGNNLTNRMQLEAALKKAFEKGQLRMHVFNERTNEMSSRVVNL